MQNCVIHVNHMTETYVFTKVGNDEKLHGYSMWKNCKHKSEFVKIYHKRSHFQLVVDNKRPHIGKECKGERRSVRTRQKSK